MQPKNGICHHDVSSNQERMPIWIESIQPNAFFLPALEGIAVEPSSCMIPAWKL
jgi:hypothetical protein